MDDEKEIGNQKMVGKKISKVFYEMSGFVEGFEICFTDIGRGKIKGSTEMQNCQRR